MSNCLQSFSRSCKSKYAEYMWNRANRQTTRLLQTLEPESVEWLSFNGQQLQVRCASVYDGDTATLVLPFHNTFYRRKCRLLGIDTAEIRTKNEDEKEVAIRGRDRLVELTKDRVIYALCGKEDKYGRLLVTLYPTEVDMKLGRDSFNDLLVKENLAYEYDGRGKRSFEDWYKDECSHLDEDIVDVSPEDVSPQEVEKCT